MNNDIILYSNILNIVKINKKTNAKMFKDLKIGDNIQVSVLVEHLGSNRGRSYTPHLKIKNIKTRECTLKTFNEFSNILKSFDVEILNALDTYEEEV